MHKLLGKKSSRHCIKSTLVSLDFSEIKVSSPDRGCLEFGDVVCQPIDQANWQVRVVVGQNDLAWWIDAFVETYFVYKFDTGVLAVVEGASKPRVFVLPDHILAI